LDAEGISGGLVARATWVELERLGASQTVEGARAMNLAAVLDDRAGVQAGGVAATDKQLGLLMASIRENAVPEVLSPVDALIEDELEARKRAKAGVSDTAGVVRTTERANRGRR
jgi:hypothetical protein